MGNVFHRHADHACSQSSEKSEKRKSVPDTDRDFIQQVVEELIDGIPEKSVVPVASSSRNSLSNECVTETESDLKRCQQDTISDTDVTEYESATDTERSGILSSSASLLTFSDQLSYERRVDSCSCSVSENEKKLDCVCVLKLSDGFIGVQELSNSAINEGSSVISNSSFIDEFEKQKVSPLNINEAISPTSSSTSPEVNNFILVEETPQVGVESSNTENVNSCGDDNFPCLLDVGLKQPEEKLDNFTEQKPDDESNCQWNVIKSDESLVSVREQKEQNTDLQLKTESLSPICDTCLYLVSPVSVLVSSFGDSCCDQSSSSCSEVTKSAEDFDLEKHSQSEVLSGYVSENFSFVAAEASKIAEDIFNALEDLDCDDTTVRDYKMSSLGEGDSDILEANYSKSQCDQVPNSLSQNYYLDGATKENSNSQNSLRLKKAQGDEMLQNSNKNLKEIEGNTDSPSKMKAADVGACAKEIIEGNTKSNHDLKKESMYNKFDNLVDVVSRHTHNSSPCNEENSLPIDSSIDDNENSRSSLQLDDSRCTPVRNVALEYIEKLISLTPNQTPNQTPRNRSTASDLSLCESQKEHQESPNNTVNSTNATKWSDISNIDHQKMPDRLRQLREVVVHQEALHKEEIKKYQKKMKSLEDREFQINRKMLENCQGQQQMSLILEEYEKTISRLVAEKEHERQAYDLEKENLLKEKDAISGHLSNIEIAFSDVHQKYEKSKQVIQGFKNNEEVLRATVSDYEAALKKQEQKYEILKSHAMGQLESANQELIAMRRTHEAENSKLKAMLKKAEIKIHSLEETLQQKIKENQELVNICDELIGKVGSSE